MKYSDMYEQQLVNFQLIFDRIQAKPEMDRFIRRMSRYSGISRNQIYFLPGVLDYDPVLLNTCHDIKQKILALIDYESQTPNTFFNVSKEYIYRNFDKRCIDGIVDSRKYLKKSDITRLDNVMSSSMPGTLGNPEKLAIKIAPVVKSFFISQLNKIKDLFIADGGFRVNEVIHKRKDSSCGSFFGSNSHVFFQGLVSNFLYRLETDPEKLQCDLMSCSKLLTQPLTRRMPKAMKHYKDYDVSMVLHEFDRKLDSSIVKDIKRLCADTKVELYSESFHELGGPKHRFVNNVSEIERMAQLINALTISNHKSRMNTAFIFDENQINNVLQELAFHNRKIEAKDSNGKAGYLYSALAMDVSGFDKSTNEELMMAMAHHLDSFTNFKFNQIIRQKNDLFFPSNNELISFTEFANHLMHTNNDTMIGLNSGLTWVTFAGKTANTIMSYFLVQEALKDMLVNESYLDQISVVNYCDGSLIIKKDMLRFPYNEEDLIIFCLNTGDDMVIISNIYFLNNYLKQYDNYLKKTNEEHVMYVYEQQFDNEYLSKFIFYDDENKSMHLGPNVIRRVASLLKPEHSVLKEGKESDSLHWSHIISDNQRCEGLYKDILISLDSKLSDLKDFKEILDIIQESFLANFGLNYSNLVNELYKHITVLDDADNEIYNKLSLSQAEKMLMDNPEIAYYKLDMRKINPILLERLFVNITPEEYLPALHKIGMLIKGDGTHYQDNISKDISEESERWNILRRNINGHK